MKPTPDSDEELAARLRDAARDPAPPPDVLARAIALRSPLREAARRTAAAVRRLIAEPVFDAAAGLGAAAGVRSIGIAGRQLLFRAEACEVDLRVNPQGTAWTLAGQVFGMPEARHVVLAGPDGQRIAELSATREFVFTGLAGGRYELTVRTLEVDIVIPALEVGRRP